MARDLMPVVKRSRREKIALHPKAIKAMTKKPYGPGEHGQTNLRSKPSQYAIQLREKQKVKRLYGLLEKQFATLVGQAEHRPGVTGDIMLQMLEQRLDNAVYRIGFAGSRQAARQLVTHGHFILNDRRVDIPSIRLKPGDEFKVRPKSQTNEYFKLLEPVLKSAKPDVRWLSLDAAKLSVKVTGLPAREDVVDDINEQLIIEFYSR
ncbi:MAG TPA: 30S ribosomal protein S4 [Candidatus Saccharimonadales bacterium]|nr:30S ribosomal protein S4 [Candidatus Saccharimonadales bacterium]